MATPTPVVVTTVGARPVFLIGVAGAGLLARRSTASMFITEERGRAVRFAITLANAGPQLPF
eukprot:1742335-Lingulodinium_polyedra.AAC.1